MVKEMWPQSGECTAGEKSETVGICSKRIFDPAPGVIEVTKSSPLLRSLEFTGRHTSPQKSKGKILNVGIEVRKN